MEVLFIQEVSRVYTSLFLDRLVKNGCTGTKCFQGFRETGPGTLDGAGWPVPKLPYFSGRGGCDTGYGRSYCVVFLGKTLNSYSASSPKCIKMCECEALEPMPAPSGQSLSWFL